MPQLCTPSVHCGPALGARAAKPSRAAVRHCAQIEAQTARDGAQKPRHAQPFLDPKILARFLALPEALFARLMRRQSLRRNDAVTLSIAFAIAMLCIAPVRPRTAVNTQRRRNLFESSDGVHRVVRLHYAAEEVKNKAELEFQISGVTLNLFDLYASEPFRYWLSP